MKQKLTTVTLGVIVFAALVGAAPDVVRLAWEPKTLAVNMIVGYFCTKGRNVSLGKS